MNFDKTKDTSNFDYEHSQDFVYPATETQSLDLSNLTKAEETYSCHAKLDSHIAQVFPHDGDGPTDFCEYKVRLVSWILSCDYYFT